MDHQRAEPQTITPCRLDWSNCRGGPPWPPQVEIPRWGGHGGPPLQLLSRSHSEDLLPGREDLARIEVALRSHEGSP